MPFPVHRISEGSRRTISRGTSERDAPRFPTPEACSILCSDLPGMHDPNIAEQQDDKERSVRRLVSLYMMQGL
jgi:hypothetical protein